MVCHCSGGTGRTGTFIGIWNSLDRLTTKNDLDLLCLVGQMRQQRRKIVFNSVRYRPCGTLLAKEQEPTKASKKTNEDSLFNHELVFPESGGS